MPGLVAGHSSTAMHHGTHAEVSSASSQKPDGRQWRYFTPSKPAPQGASAVALCAVCAYSSVSTQLQPSSLSSCQPPSSHCAVVEPTPHWCVACAFTAVRGYTPLALHAHVLLKVEPHWPLAPQRLR